MLNNTDICNMALAYLAKGRIANINEQSELARQCKLFYETTKKSLLRDYSWGFAKRVIKLAELTEESPYWNNLYAYPEKCVCVRKIFAADNGKIVTAEQEKEKWDLFLATDNVLAIGCDIEQAWMEYTYDVDDAELFSADFLEAFTHMLAFNICLQLTGNTVLQQQQYQLAQNALSRAKYTTAAEKHSKPEYPSKYFDGRA
ncbi:MAG: hypothetical protein IKT51_01260 [Phascolarctobacterium sp.]|nr:hypothetical protein [Phascolarctobacterium sp.]